MSEFSSHIEKTKQNESSGDAAHTHSPSLTTSVATAPGVTGGGRTLLHSNRETRPSAFDCLSLKYMYRNRAPLLVMSLKSSLVTWGGRSFWPQLVAGWSSTPRWVLLRPGWLAWRLPAEKGDRMLSGHCSASLSSMLESAPSALALVPACSQSVFGG